MPDAKNPSINDTIEEIQAVFPNDAALQDAIARLGLLGFDRADLSITSAGGGEPGDHTPESGAASPTTDTDVRQLRALGGGMVGMVGAMAAGAAIIGTGGAAAPAVAAMAAAGIGSAAAMQGAQRTADTVRANDRDAAGARGDLILSVRLREPSSSDPAQNALRDAGATRVAPVRRQDSGAAAVTASGWTG